MPPRARRAAALLTALLGAASCGEEGPTGPVPVASVVVAPNPAAVRVGETVQLTATAQDQSGNNLTNRTVTWTSVNSAIAAVSNGAVLGVAEGSTTVSAVIDGTEGSVTVTVDPARVTSVDVRPASPSVLIGETLQMTATPRSASGTPLPGRAVTWSSSDEQVATVTTGGLVQGLTGGPVTITATVEQQTGFTSVEIVDPTAPQLTSITPFPMVEGGSATITGVNFGATPGENAVTVDGVAASVTAADGATVTFTVPATGCRPLRDVSVRVTAGGKSGARTHPIRPAAFTLVGVGEQVMLPGGSCLQLDATNSFESYLVGVYSTAASASTLSPAALTGRTGLASGAATAPPASGALAASGPGVAPGWLRPVALPFPARSSAPGGRVLDAAQLEALRTHAVRHLEARRSETEALEAERPDLALARAGALPSVIPPGAQIGQTFPVRVPPHFPGSCTASTAITAELRLITPRGLWLRETGLTSGFSDGQLQQIADAFEGQVAPVLEATFGPIPDSDGDGRIAFVSTGRVNQEGWLSYASLSDYRPVSECPASNEGDWAYLATPQAGTSFTASFLLEVLPQSLAHDFTHVIQNRAVIAGGVRADPWIEEGQATLGEEVFSHSVANPARSPLQNYGSAVIFSQSGSAVPYAMVSGLVLYYGFLGASEPKALNAPEQCSWLLPIPGGGAPPGPCDPFAAFSGSWAFLRWLTDHFGAAVGGDGALHQALIDTPGPGFDRVAALAGLPIEMLLARFGASLYVDDRISLSDALLGFPSWNLFELDQAVFQQGQLAPRNFGYQGFTQDVSVRGGSTAYFRLSGPGRPATAVELTGPGGVAPSSDLRVWVVRLD